jgi:hypothetical protein
MSTNEAKISEHQEAIEKTKSTEAQKLDDATFEPRAVVERTGDYKQSESIQAAFSNVVSASIASANQDLTHIHTANETYYTGERASGPHPHTFGQDRKPAEDPNGDKTRTGFPNMNELGPSSYLDSAETGGNSSDSNLASVQPPPPPPDRTEGEGSSHAVVSRRIAGNPVTAISEQPHQEKTKPIHAPVDPTSDSGIGDPIIPSVMADVGQPNTISGQQPKVVDGVFSGKDDDGDGDKEHITPINLPGIQHAARPRNDEGMPSARRAEVEQGGTIVSGQPKLSSNLESAFRETPDSYPPGVTDNGPAEFTSKISDSRSTVSGGQPAYSIDALVDRALHDEAGPDHYGERHVDEHTMKPQDPRAGLRPAHDPVPEGGGMAGQAEAQGAGDRDTISGQQPHPVAGAFSAKDGADPQGKSTPVIPAPPPNANLSIGGESSAGTSNQHVATSHAPDPLHEKLADDRSTISGQQPKYSIDALVDRALHDEAGPDHYGERHIEEHTMKPLDSRAEMRPAHTPIPFSGTPGKVDSDTGMVKNPSKNDGAASAPGSPPSVFLDKQSWTRVEDRHPSEPRRDGPPEMAKPGGDTKGEHVPYVPRSEASPTASGKQGHGGQSDSALGPQELAHDRLAELALNALGLGASGVITGAYAGGSQSSSSGAPVHQYGHGSVGEVDQIEDDEEPPENNGPAPLTDPDGVTSSDSGGHGTETVGSVKVYGSEKGPGGTTPQDRYESTNPGAKPDFVQSFFGETYTIYTDKNGNRSAFIWNTVDGGNPMPYTGNWSGGRYTPKDPSTIGGNDKENDSGRLMPVLRQGGQGYQGGGNNATDEPGMNDEGKFYGGIFGGGGIILSDNQPGVVDPIQGGEISRKATRK